MLLLVINQSMTNCFVLQGPSICKPLHLHQASQFSGNGNLLSTLISRFQGDFDNYEQVYSDRKNGLFPREGGGHEHFHVTLIPLPISIIPDKLFPGIKDELTCGAVVAAYYFDGMPNRIFRLRMYILYCEEENREELGRASEEKVRMQLYTFNPQLEEKLRSQSENSILKWTNIIGTYTSTHSETAFIELPRCDISWTEEPDPERHDYLEEISEIEEKKSTDPIHAIMINDHDKGGVLLKSQMMSDTLIRVQDELSLWDNELWINDRGHNAETGAMIYGNWIGVPYQMKRVTSLSQDENGQFTREIVDSDLMWTLGDSRRSQEEYNKKMKDVGGITTRINKKNAQSNFKKS